MMDMKAVPELVEWMTASQAAKALSISRQSVNRMMNQGEFKTLRALGPIFVVRRSEVAKAAAARAKKLKREKQKV